MTNNLPRIISLMFLLYIAYSRTLIHNLQASELVEPQIIEKPIEVVKTQEIIKTEFIDPSEIVDTIHLLESGRGTNNNPSALHNYCKAQGKSNEYGFGGMRLKHCFETETLAKARVTLWVVEHLKKFDGNIARTLCFYNLGQNTTECEYYQKFLSVRSK